MKSDTKSFYLAIILSAAAILIINWLWPAAPSSEVALSEDETKKEAVLPSELEAEQSDDGLYSPLGRKIVAPEEALKQDRRIAFSNSKVSGSIRVKGARFDDLSLLKYKQTLDPESQDVVLLQPSATKDAYYAEFGWLANDNYRLPDRNTLWNVIGGELTPDSPIILEWQNGQGLKFVRKISLDDNYMFSIENTIENRTGKDVVLYPYGLIHKVYQEGSASSKVVHEGMLGVLDSSLKEVSTGKLDKGEKKEFTTRGGWAGFGERYWFTAFIFGQSDDAKVHFGKTDDATYQADFTQSPITIQNGAVGSSNLKFYAGAKEIKLLDDYTKNLNIDKFDLAVDFGWYYFLTKPFFYILDFLYHIIGNMGWAILLFAALLRLAMFPVANKSYESMSKMKKVQPKIQAIQQTYPNDKMRQQQAMMELYCKEKINPTSGCLPMLIQIPVFFSLYKVLNIAIEIRQAPFVGWIKDLSAPDPLTLSAMSGLPIPSMIDLGVWPILMGLTMYLQQKLSPSPANKDQARMMLLLPVIFTFMLGHFASGLVIYWTLSNILSIIQQKAIMRKYGVK